MNILLFPRTLNFIEKKYGNYGKMIFEQFIQYGVLTLHQIIEQILNSSSNGNNYELVKKQVVELFVKLYEDNLIMYSERTNEEENYYTNNKNDNLLGNKEEIKKNKKIEKKSSNKKVKSNNKKKKN